MQQTKHGKQVLFLHCQTPLHAGSGSDLGVVDLPIQRERHTSYPKIEASSLKGATREHFETVYNNNDDAIIKIHKVFGFDSDAAKYQGLSEKFKDHEEFSGALALSDARLLLFPVKSMKGVFAWVTCPQVLAKFKQELELMGKYDTFEVPTGGTVSLSTELIIKNKQVVIEEYSIPVERTEKVNTLAMWLSANVLQDAYLQDKVLKNLLVLSDDDFRDFVSLSTEVITRTKIDNQTGTVAQSALFTEEYLPTESVLYSLTFASAEFTKKQSERMEAEDVEKFVKDTFIENPILQIGGNATLGKGLVKTKLI